MKFFNLNGWGIESNQASKSLFHLHAKFKILKNDECVYYQLIVTDKNMKTVTFNFYTLEDVIYFVEDVVNKCMNNEEVVTNYQQMFEDGVFSLPGGMKHPKKETISLTQSNVEEALISYFGKGKKYDISIRKELSVDFRGEPKLLFYLIEHINYEGVRKDYECLLTEGDLQKALASYVDAYGYELVSFKYIGGVHRVGYFFDEDTPHYEGIEVKVVPKENVQESPKRLIRTFTEAK